jgi:DNA-binding Lrp family transcriptional regulator
MDRTQLQKTIREFEQELKKISTYVDTARLGGYQLHWKNYRRLYLSTARKARSHFSQIENLLPKSKETQEILAKPKHDLDIIFNVETSTEEKYEALQRFYPLWGDFKASLGHISGIEHAIFRKGQFKVDPKLCFVLMPFDEIFKPVYDQIIKVTVEKTGLKCKRADDIFGTNPIIDDIWEYINKAKIIIADLTNKNPNVFYEIGISHALEKRVVLLTQKIEDVPFDLRHIRCVTYKDDAKGREKLGESLFETLKNLLE